MSAKSNFSSLYKKGATNVRGDKSKRRSVERRAARHETLNRNRGNLHTSRADNLSVVVEQAPKTSLEEKGQQRKQMLLKWKKEKEERMKQEVKKKKPTFRVAHFSPESLSLHAMEHQPVGTKAGSNVATSKSNTVVTDKLASRAAAGKQQQLAVPNTRSKTAKSEPSAAAAKLVVAATRSSAFNAAAAAKSSSGTEVRGVRGKSQKPPEHVTDTRSTSSVSQKSKASPPPVATRGRNLRSGSSTTQTNGGKAADTSKVTKISEDSSGAAASKSTSIINKSQAEQRSGRTARTTSDTVPEISSNLVDSFSRVTRHRGEASFAPTDHMFVPPANLMRFDFELNVPTSDSSMGSIGRGLAMSSESNSELENVESASNLASGKSSMVVEKQGKNVKGKLRSKSKNRDSFSPVAEDVVEMKNLVSRARRSRYVPVSTAVMEEGEKQALDPVDSAAVTSARKSVRRSRKSQAAGRVNNENASSTDETAATAEKEVLVEAASSKRSIRRKSTATSTEREASSTIFTSDIIASSDHVITGSGSDNEEPVNNKSSRRSTRRRKHVAGNAAVEASSESASEVIAKPSERDTSPNGSDEDDVFTKSPRKIARVTSSEVVASATKNISKGAVRATRRRTVASIADDNNKMDTERKKSEIYVAEESKPSVKDRKLRRTINAIVSSQQHETTTDSVTKSSYKVIKHNISMESLKLNLDSDTDAEKISNGVEHEQDKLASSSSTNDMVINATAANNQDDVVKSDEKENVSRLTDNTETMDKKSLTMTVESIPLSCAQLNDDSVLSVFRTPRQVPLSALRRRRTVAGEVQMMNDHTPNRSTNKLFRNSSVLRNKSPEEGIEILKRSPMIELNRRVRRTTSDDSNSSILMPDLSEFDCMAGDTNKVNPGGDGMVSSTTSAATDSTVSSISDEALSVSKCQAAAHKFRALVESDVLRLNALCEEWRNVLAQSDGLSDEADGQIRSVIGQTEWVMSKRFKQFGTVINNCEFQNGDRMVQPSDLQGYYDALYWPNVEEIDTKFKELTKAKESSWVSENAAEVVPKFKKAAVKSVKSNTAVVKKPVQSRFAAFKQKMAQERLQQQQVGMDGKACNEEGVITETGGGSVETEAIASAATAVFVMTSPSSELKTFDGGFFSVSSPVAKLSSRKSSLAEQTDSMSDALKSRCSYNVATETNSSLLNDPDAGSQTPLAKAVLKNMMKRRSEIISMSTIKDCSSSNNQQVQTKNSKRKTVSFITEETLDHSGIDAKYLQPVLDVNDTLCTPCSSVSLAILEDGTPSAQLKLTSKQIDQADQPLVRLSNDEDEDNDDVSSSSFSTLNISFTPGKEKMSRRVSGFTPPVIYSRRSRGGRLESIADEADEDNLMQFSPASIHCTAAVSQQFENTNTDAVSKIPLRRSIRRSVLKL